MDLTLRADSSPAWLETVLEQFDDFLLDHASCEKKASGMAMSMISHYPDKAGLIREMLNLALEELNHYREVMKLILDRGLQPAADTRDEYINHLHQAMDRGKEQYLLDRLLIAAIVEARGAERFGLIATALPDGKMQDFYRIISESEARHYQLFLDLAETYCDNHVLPARLDQLLELEADILARLPVRAALH